MNDEIPFIAIGNGELDAKPKAGKTTPCRTCKKKHKIIFGKDSKTGLVSKLLGFYKCGDKTFLASIDGKLMY